MISLNFPSLLTTIATLFFLMAVGFVAGKLGIINGTASKNLSRLIIAIAQPALIIDSLVKMEYSPENLRLGLLTLLLGLAIHGFLAVIAFFAFTPFRNLDERKLSEFSAVFGNVGFVGFPILSSILGDRGLFMGAFFVISFHLTLWTWGIAILARKRDDIKLTPKKIFLNYGTVPCLIGFVLFVLGGLLPSVLPAGVTNVLSAAAPSVLSTLSYVASLCTPISMLITGALLASRSLSQILGSGKIYYLCAVKLVLTPLLVCALMKLIGFDPMWIQFAVVIIAMPSASTVTMLAELHDISPGYAAQAVGTTSLISIATMPCVIWLAQKIIEL